MQKVLYINLMVATNQTPVIDMKIIKRKGSKYITKESQQTMREEQEKKGAKNCKNNHETMAMGTYLSIITLNVMDYMLQSKDIG